MFHARFLLLSGKLPRLNLLRPVYLMFILALVKVKSMYFSNPDWIAVGQELFSIEKCKNVKM